MGHCDVGFDTLAATAAANNLPLYTRNPDDFRALKDIVNVIAI